MTRLLLPFLSLLPWACPPEPPKFRDGDCVPIEGRRGECLRVEVADCHKPGVCCLHALQGLEEGHFRAMGMRKE